MRIVIFFLVRCILEELAGYGYIQELGVWEFGLAFGFGVCGMRRWWCFHKFKFDADLLALVGGAASKRLATNTTKHTDQGLGSGFKIPRYTRVSP